VSSCFAFCTVKTQTRFPNHSHIYQLAVLADDLIDKTHTRINTNAHLSMYLLVVLADDLIDKTRLSGGETVSGVGTVGVASPYPTEAFAKANGGKRAMERGKMVGDAGICSMFKVERSISRHNVHASYNSHSTHDF
jgi:hypothetical protein